MRDQHHAHIDVLVAQLADTCETVGEAMRRATTALLEADLALAEQVIRDDERIDTPHSEPEANTHHLPALRSPNAADLCTILAVGHTTASLARMGTLATHVAEAVRRRHPRPVLPAPLRPRFVRMGRIAVDMAAIAGHAIRHRDMALADALRETDAEMDELHRTLFTVFTSGSSDYGVTTAIDAILLSECYERFGDHAVFATRRTVCALAGQTLATEVPRVWGRV